MGSRVREHPKGVAQCLWLYQAESQLPHLCQLECSQCLRCVLKETCYANGMMAVLKGCHANGELDLLYGLPEVLSLRVPQHHMKEWKLGIIFLPLLGRQSQTEGNGFCHVRD